MHNAGLNGEPIGEPRICSKTEVPMENWVIFKDIRMMRSMSRMKIFLVTLSVRHVRAFDYIACGIARGRLD